MIKVQRRAEPLVIVSKKATWTNALLNATTKDQRKRAESKYGHPSIKNALVEMFHGKCAYCESKIVHVDYGHIEHFRPKSVEKFRPLTFEWSNLFLACAKCNGPEYKSGRFPEHNEGGPPINPCDDSPDEHLVFFFDLKTKVATVSYKTERGRVSRDLFGLNRPDLRAHRSKFVEKLFLLSRLAETDIEARSLLDQSKNDEEEYAAFSRSLIRQISTT
ncbi:MAG: retron system putative HNH endonuclease [Terracidiphilus sp.]